MQYMFYFFFVLLGVFHLYKVLTTDEERKSYRTKLLKEINQRKSSLIKNNQKSKLQEDLKKTGFAFLSALHFQIARFTLIIIISGYYLLSNLLSSSEFKFGLLLLPGLFIVITEPKLKYSVPSFLLRFLTKRKQKRCIIELFHLFDLLKSEFNSSNNVKQINIYNVLKDFLPMFREIQGTLARFLILWKHSPERASKVFESEIGGQSAKVLGDLIYKLDNTSQGRALEIIQSEANVFSTDYYENELQTSAKQKTVYYIYFVLTILITVAWLLIFISAMMVKDSLW